MGRMLNMGKFQQLVCRQGSHVAVACCDQLLDEAA